MTMTDFFVRTFARLAWGTINAVSANITGVSAARETVDELVQFRLLEAVVSAANGGVGYVSDLTTSAGLALGLVNTVAPEALGLSEKDWDCLKNSQDAIARLKTYARECSENVQHGDVGHFLHAARVLTVASALAYADEETAQRQMGEGSWKVKLVSINKAQAMLFLAREKKKNAPVAILAFRGTEQPDDDYNREFVPDWVRNFKFKLTDYREGKVARGILESWTALKDEILKELQQFSEDSMVDLFVTGHSQGGALASVSLLDLLADQPTYYRVNGCLTIAQFRIGDENHRTAVSNAVQVADIPLDLVANEDVMGIDPAVSFGGEGTVAPPGRFWKVRVGKETTGPLSVEDHRAVAEEDSLATKAYRVCFCAPLHWPGGRVGYLSALEK